MGRIRHCGLVCLEQSWWLSVRFCWLMLKRRKKKLRKWTQTSQCPAMLNYKNNWPKTSITSHVNAERKRRFKTPTGTITRRESTSILLPANRCSVRWINSIAAPAGPVSRSLSQKITSWRKETPRMEWSALRFEARQAIRIWVTSLMMVPHQPGNVIVWTPQRCVLFL
jgi:hypothetical protein